MKKNCPCKRKDIVREGKKMKGKKRICVCEKKNIYTMLILIYIKKITNNFRLI